jgi:hypothetical protein
MPLLQAIGEWRAARRLTRLIEQSGGRHAYEAEQRELRERASALAVLHSHMKKIFGLTDDLTNSTYRIVPKATLGTVPRHEKKLLLTTGKTDFTLRVESVETNPLVLMQAVTELAPPSLTKTFQYSEVREQRGGGDMPEYRPPYHYDGQGRAEKSYTLRPRIVGYKFMNSGESAADEHFGPYVGFSYFHRQLCNTVVPSEYAAEQFAGGLVTTELHFAAIIHDGHRLVETKNPSVAGFVETTKHLGWKQPTRICLLGSLEHGDRVNVYRLIMDGVPLELTRENFDVALQYAKLLVEGIISGKHYKPAEAAVQARNKPPQTGLRMTFEHRKPR